jgi:hypothetical protein
MPECYHQNSPSAKLRLAQRSGYTNPLKERDLKVNADLFDAVNASDDGTGKDLHDDPPRLRGGFGLHGHVSSGAAQAVVNAIAISFQPEK